MKADMSRRAFVGSIAAAGLTLSAADEWIDLFDRHSLSGWRAAENPSSWKVVDGLLTADGPRSHLFYQGPVNSANFRNFELEAEVMAKPHANSGIYFHTAYQETGFPVKGFEVQVANSPVADNGYTERKLSGSLYGLRNVHKRLISDDEWFRLNVLVRGKSVQVRLNGMLVVDYVEPSPPVIPDGMEKQRFLDRGTFALQCHGPNLRAMYRRVRVRPLPDNASFGEAPAVDDTFRQIINLGRHNMPMVDLHVHLKEGLTLEQALTKSRRDGIFYGITVNCGKGFPVENDAGVRDFLKSMKGQPCFIGMQAEGREWMTMFSRSAAAEFDYIFTDSMTWSDDNGKRMRLWIPEEVGSISDPQAFMEMLVKRAVGILEREPVDIYVNPTFLPDVISKDYDTLWTEARMRRIVDAAKASGVAIEINSRYKLPSATFIKMAKAAGCKFTFGTNNAGPGDLGRSEYGLRMVGECKLEWQDFFVPGAWGPKAVDRKPEALKG